MFFKLNLVCVFLPNFLSKNYENVLSLHDQQDF